MGEPMSPRLQALIDASNARRPHGRAQQRRAGLSARQAGEAAERPVRDSLVRYRLSLQVPTHRSEPPRFVCPGDRSAANLPIAADLKWAQPVARFERRAPGQGKAPKMLPAGKSGADVTGWVLHDGRPLAVVVEVKSSAGPRLDLFAAGSRRIDEQQSAELHRAASAGALAGVLVKIGGEKPRGKPRGPSRWYFVPWLDFVRIEREQLDAGGRSLPASVLDAEADAGRVARLRAQPWLDWLPAAIALVWGAPC